MELEDDGEEEGGGEDEEDGTEIEDVNEKKLKFKAVYQNPRSIRPSLHLTPLFRPDDMFLILKPDRAPIGWIIIKGEFVSLSVMIYVGDRIEDLFPFTSVFNVREGMEFETLSPGSKEDGLVYDFDKTIGIFGVSGLSHP